MAPFGGGYLRCDSCQTLVVDGGTTKFDPRVRDERADLYGEHYWFGHQTQDLGLPDLISRARTDLSDRCAYWLRTLLTTKRPPGRVLEVGCGHGGFVSLLSQAGFSATGLELSAAVVRFARETFGVAVLTGPVEDQAIHAGSLDVVVMMDVMEHLADPLGTITRCLDLLVTGGVLLVQTPAYPEGQSLAEMTAAGHQFPRMLDVREHPFLFSRSSAAALLNLAGAPHVRFAPAIYSQYDMCFFASRDPLPTITPAEADAALEATPTGRVVRALLDCDRRRWELLTKYRQLRDGGPVEAA